jgi:hypothetical protein
VGPVEARVVGKWTLWCGMLSLAACGNPCQSLCGDMATLSDELGCGVTYSDAEVQACEDAFADADAADLKTCRDYGGLEVMRQNWTCDDINLYRAP